MPVVAIKLRITNLGVCGGHKIVRKCKKCWVTDSLTLTCLQYSFMSVGLLFITVPHLLIGTVCQRQTGWFIVKEEKNCN